MEAQVTVATSSAFFLAGTKLPECKIMTQITLLIDGKIDGKLFFPPFFAPLNSLFLTKSASYMGWIMGLEPTTTGITIRGSTN
jgi:hypothetical protein